VKTSLALLVPCLVLVAGCQRYELVQTHKADLSEEQAAALKAYRDCLAKYAQRASEGEEQCASDAQRLREVEGSALPSAAP
jgi:hypothetical protein